ncbi:MAG: calcium-binding protein [Dinoroseobacter sp.]|nr:calcium-binding protein [Dinoroseobacter sp.]
MTDLVHIGTLTHTPSGALATVTGLWAQELGGDMLLYADSPAGDTVSVFAVPAAGQASFQSEGPRPPEMPILFAPPPALPVSLGGQPLLLHLSTDTHALILSTDAGDGTPEIEITRVGAGDGLGIQAPTGLELIEAWGKTYAIVGSAGSSSVTVVEVTQAGALVPRDHVFDDMESRFSGVTALTSTVAGDRVFLGAGGADDGLTLFELLPNGQLLLRDTVEDAAALTLDDPAALAMVATDYVLQVFAGSESEAGITQFSASLGVAGVTLIAGTRGENLNGGSGDDRLIGGPDADMLHGHAGRDTLLDGAGADTLSGGTGRDLFVLVADGAEDHIFDFDPTQDALDLSGWAFLRDPAQLQITTTATGAAISYGAESLILTSADGGAISVQSLLALDLLPLSRAPFLSTTAPESLFGTGGSDFLEGNHFDNTVSGGAGSDTLLGAEGDDTMGGGIGADLLDGGAGDDILRGDGGYDLLIGSAGADWLYGNAGNDRLDGGAGDDALYGGIGADTLLGGAGNDTLSGAEGFDDLQGGEGADILQGNSGNDTLDGGAGADDLRGGQGNDVLYGRDGADVLRGETGADQIFGGAGNDTVAGGDGSDWLDGGEGDDLLIGFTGADTFVFASGHDVIEDFGTVDQILLDAVALGIVGMSPQEVIDQYRTTQDGDSVFDFGDGNVLTVEDRPTGPFFEAAIDFF